MPRLSIRLISLVFLAVLPLTAFSQTEGSDLSEYIDAVSKLRGLSIDRQIESLKTYLENHPESPFRDEVESNINQLNRFLTTTDPTKKRAEKDTELYLKAVGLAKTLPAEEQAALWEQFLKENPDTMYKKDILYKLSALRSKLPRTQANPNAPSETAPKAPVVRRLAYKDKDKALLLSIFPGLVVPGIAHWYTRDYMIAGIITAFRIVGLGVGFNGYVNQSDNAMLVGGIITTFSYGADIIDAPFTVDRYNDALEAANPAPPISLGITPRSLLVSYRF